jgi:hypothetical protein
MAGKLMGVLLAFCALGWAAEKPIPSGKMADGEMEIEALLYLKTEQIKEALGVDPGPGVVVVHLKLIPKPGKAKNLFVDDFTLSSDKDGQSSGPFSPAQIASNSTLTIQETPGTVVGTRDTGPVWGGVPGTGGPMGRLPGNGGGIGTAPGVTETRAQIDTEDPEQAGGKKPNPLLDALTAKALVSGEIVAPREGFLYFPLDGKHKPKQIELIYGTKRTSQIRLKFSE